jgi:hypothetical protein
MRNVAVPALGLIAALEKQAGEYKDLALADTGTRGWK